VPSSTDVQVPYGKSPQAETHQAGIYDQATQPHAPTAAMGVVDADPNARPVIRVRNLKKTYLLEQTPCMPYVKSRWMSIPASLWRLWVLLAPANRHL
jgi:hypothetical protein